MLNNFDLLFLGVEVFVFESIELSDENINFGSILTDSRETVSFDFLLFELHSLVLLLEVSELLLKGAKISLS